MKWFSFLFPIATMNNNNLSNNDAVLANLAPLRNKRERFSSAESTLGVPTTPSPTVEKQKKKKNKK